MKDVRISYSKVRCTCLTKTPDPQFHEDLCRYRVFREAEQEVRGYIENALANGYDHVATDDPHDLALDILAYTDTNLTIEQMVHHIKTVIREPK